MGIVTHKARSTI